MEEKFFLHQIKRTNGTFDKGIVLMGEHWPEKWTAPEVQNA